MIISAAVSAGRSSNLDISRRFCSAGVSPAILMILPGRKTAGGTPALQNTTLFCEESESAGGIECQQATLGRRDALQFQKSEAGFLQFGYFGAGVQDVADYEVQMRFV